MRACQPKLKPKESGFLLVGQVPQKGKREFAKILKMLNENCMKSALKKPQPQEPSSSETLSEEDEYEDRASSISQPFQSQMAEQDLEVQSLHSFGTKSQAASSSEKKSGSSIFASTPDFNSSRKRERKQKEKEPPMDRG